MAKNTILDIIIGLKDKASGPFKSLENVFHSGIERLKSAATGLAIGAVAALTTAFWQLTKSIKEFAQQELGEFDVESALKAMGQYTDQYKQKLIDLANQYQKTTNIGDESWLKTFGQLTRFGMNAENVDRVAAAVKNLAALMDGNIDGAAMAMQRALEGEFSMFSRYGIKLELTGNAKQDLNALFDNLEKKGSGLLEARAETLSGKWQALKNSISDFQEEVGRVLTDALGLKGGIAEVAIWFDKLQESAKSGALHDILKSAGEQVREWAKTITDIVEQIKNVEDLKIVAGVIGDWLKEKLIEGGQRIVTYLAENAPIVGNAIGKAILSAMTEFFSGPNPVWRMTHPEENYGASVDDLKSKGRELAGQITGQVEISLASQQSLADRINAALQTSRDATPDTQLITVKIPEGEFIGDAKGVQEFIDNLRETDAAMADMLQQALDTQEGAGKVQEETTKSLDAVRASHTNIETTMRSAAAAATATSQVATQTVQITQQVVAAQALQAGQLSSLFNEISRINSQLRSMRA